MLEHEGRGLAPRRRENHTRQRRFRQPALNAYTERSSRMKGAAGFRCRQLDGRAAILRGRRETRRMRVGRLVLRIVRTSALHCSWRTHTCNRRRIPVHSRKSLRGSDPASACARHRPVRTNGAGHLAATTRVSEPRVSLLERVAAVGRDAVQDRVRSVDRVVARRARRIPSRRPRPCPPSRRPDAAVACLRQGSRGSGSACRW